MFCTPTKKRALEEADEPVRTPASTSKSFSFLEPGSPFAGLASFKKTEEVTELARGSDKMIRKLEHDLKMAQLDCERRKIQIDELKSRIENVPLQFSKRITVDISRIVRLIEFVGS